MGELLGETARRLARCHGRGGTARQPMRPYRERAAAHAGIVAAIEKRQRSMLLRVVEADALSDMALGGGQLTEPERRRPHGMVRLEQQSAVVGTLREGEQLASDRACVPDSPEPGRDHPLAPERLDRKSS